MPPIEEADFIHTAVVWPFLRMNRDNEPVLDAPIEVPCRWVPDQRQSVNQDGIEVTITARLACPIDLLPRSVAWKGELRAFDSSETADLHEVVSSGIVDDVQGKNTRREYDLARFRGKLPTDTPES
jgi:hypothetical protein